VFISVYPVITHHINCTDGITSQAPQAACPKDQGIAGDTQPSPTTRPPPTGLPGSPGPIGVQVSAVHFICYVMIHGMTLDYIYYTS